MTEQTPPKVSIEWEPIPEGIILNLDVPVAGKFACQMPMSSVNELRADMEEASYLASGYEKIECQVSEIDDGDRIRLMGNTYTVLNLLQAPQGWVIQFEPHSWTETLYELVLDGDETVTVWRPV